MAIAVIGHVTKDIVEINGRKEEKPGGTAFYTGIAMAQLGVKTQVFTKLSEKDRHLLGGLKHKNIELLPRFCRATTGFKNTYHGEIREQFVSSVAEPFGVSDIGKLNASIVHLGPLTKSDIPLDLFKHLKSLGIIVSLDAQGFTRTVTGKKVKKAKWKDAKKFLRYVDVLKADTTEAKLICSPKAMAATGPIEIIVTNGSKGSTVYSRGKSWKIPAFKPSVEVDLTGAGDTYVAGYLAKRLESDDIGECGRFAAMCATAKIESGVFNASRKDVENRLKAL